MIKQPLLTVKFIARTPVMYILNGHSGVYVATDVSANFSTGATIFGIGYNYKAGGGPTGVREFHNAIQ